MINQKNSLGRDEQALYDLTQNLAALLQSRQIVACLAPNEITVAELNERRQLNAFVKIGYNSYMYNETENGSRFTDLDQDTEPFYSFGIGSIWDLEINGGVKVLVRREGSSVVDKLSSIPEDILLERYYFFLGEESKRDLLLSEQSILNRIKQEFRDRGILETIEKGKF